MSNRRSDHSTFRTLLHREWMQHHRGWLVLMLALPLLLLVALPFGSVQFDASDNTGVQTPAGLMLAAMVLLPMVVLGLTAAALAFQASGLARRDVQDRSIEFWLSLPVGHAASIGATVLMQFVLVPLLAVAVGAACSYAVGAGLVWRFAGIAAVAGLPWWSLLWVGFLGLLRAAFGVLLASAWLMPLLLLPMAASAWLKRWGVPVLAIVVSGVHTWLAYRYGITAIGDTLHGWLVNAPVALVHAVSDNPTPQLLPAAADIGPWLHAAPGWLLADAVASLRELATPLFLLALLGSAVGFGLLVLRRSRVG